jgi:hypothetical protein
MTSGSFVTVNTTNHSEGAGLEINRISTGTYELLKGVAQNFTVKRNVRPCVLVAGRGMETISLCECALSV